MFTISGQKIKKLRTDSNFTVLELAKKVELSEVRIWEIESNKEVNVRPKTLKKFCEIFSCREEYLLEIPEKDIVFFKKLDKKPNKKNIPINTASANNDSPIDIEKIKLVRMVLSIYDKIKEDNAKKELLRKILVSFNEIF